MAVYPQRKRTNHARPAILTHALCFWSLMKLLTIELDDAPFDPYSHCDYLGTIVSWCRNHTVGDQPKISKRDFFERFITEDAAYLDIYLFQDGSLRSHRGPGPSLGTHVGYIFVTIDDAHAAGVSEGKVLDTLESELAEYSGYSSGNAWGYKVHNTCSCCEQPTELHDSCWGFFGAELDETGLRESISHDYQWLSDQVDEAWNDRLNRAACKAS